MRPISGAAKAKCATEPPEHIRSWWRQQRGGSSRRLLCFWDLAKFYEHVGHDHLWEEGRKNTSFPRRLLACWCASLRWLAVPQGRQVCHLSLAGPLGPLLPGCSGATTAAKLMLATLLETVQHASRPAGFGVLSTTFRGHVARVPQDGSGPHGRSGQASGGRPPGARSSSLQGHIQKSSSMARTSSSRAFCGRWRCLGSTRATRHRNVGADLQLGRRRRALRGSRGDWGGRPGVRNAVRQLRQGRGTHSQSDTLDLECWGALGFRGPGLYPTQLRAIRVDAALPFVITDKLCWPGRVEFGRARQTSTPFRRSSEGRLPVVRGHRRGSHHRAHTFTAGLERAVCEASPPLVARRSTCWRWWRRRWDSGWTRLPSRGPTALHTGITPRVHSCGKPSGRHSFLASWRSGHSGIGTCWSSWFREAFGPKTGSRGSGERTKSINVPPLL